MHTTESIDTLEMNNMEPNKTPPEPTATLPPSLDYEDDNIRSPIAASSGLRHVTRRFLGRPMRRLWAFLKGPITPTGFSGPAPWFERSFKVNHWLFSLSLESQISKLTHPFKRLWVFVLLAACYVVALAFLVRAQAFLIPASSFIGCTSTYWLPDEGCGLNGADCLYFDDGAFEFKCPAQCSSTVLENPRAVGALEPVFEPLVIGGGDKQSNGSSGIYRGDSFICAAGIHAGLISDKRGGCAALSLLPNHTDYTSSSANGITTTPFPSIFPLSFQLSPSTSLTHCSDYRNYARAFNILVTCLLFLVLRPNSVIIFWCLVCIGYWHITFFSQPRALPPPISDAFGTFLPAIFVAYAFWLSAWRFVLPRFEEMPAERLLWYLPSFWAGVEFNTVTRSIPVDRLLASDIKSRSGGIAAVTIIVVVIFTLVLNQLRVLRKLGLLITYAQWYILFGLTVLVLSQMPGLVFRLHHYFAAMLLIPLTAFPTRPSAIYQGFLLGMFLNGAAAFGFASIFQTATELVRDGALGTALPTFVTNSSNWNVTTPLLYQSLQWNAIPADSMEWDAFSLMVDDVERAASNAVTYNMSDLGAGIAHYFRLAFSKDGSSGDYTKAATLLANGSWIDPLPGAAA